MALERHKANCVYFESCGACTLLPLPYEEQLQRKAERLRHDLALQDDVTIVPSPQVDGFRKRVLLRLHINDGRVKAGYFQKGTRSLSAIDHCMIAEPSINELLRQLHGANLPAVGDMTCRMVIQTRLDQRGVDILVTPVADKPLLTLDSFMLWLRGLNQVRSAGLANLGSDEATDQERVAEGLSLYSSPRVFTQTNAAINLLIRQQIRQWVDARSVDSLLDLHCGNGNLSLPLVPDVKTAAFSDTSKDALVLLGRSLSGLCAKKNLSIEHLGAEKAIAAWIAKTISFDLVIVDPPRAGLGPAASELRHVAKQYVIYLSCDLKSFKHDAQALTQSFELAHIIAYDMFPHTEHVEVLSLWTRLKD